MTSIRPGVVCINPANNKAEAQYAEEKLSTLTYPQKGAVGEPERSSAAKPPPADPLAK